MLIIGAGGSTGIFAVQIARYFGAEVTGVDSTGKLDNLRSIGADHVIDYTQEDFTKSDETYQSVARTNFFILNTGRDKFDNIHKFSTIMHSVFLKYSPTVIGSG